MLGILTVNGRRHFRFLFLVGMILCFTPKPSLSSNTTRCFGKDREFLRDMHPGCANYTRSFYTRSFSHDCCDWPGISCSNLTGRIIGLDMTVFLDSCCDFCELSLGPSLGSQEDLVTLELDFDQVSFTTGFQSVIRCFPNVRHLYISSHDLGMAIPPELSNLTRLETLEVDSGNGDSSIMYAKTLSMLLHLTSLRRLVLSAVGLDNATDWLHVVSHLPHLEHLDLSNCHLPDVIYPSRFNVNSSKSLAYLDLSFNGLEFSSSWPWIFNHSSLVSLILSNNQLSGKIPNKFEGIASLAHLDLSHNRLEGRLPGSLRSLCGLSNFDVSQNHRLQGDLSSIFKSLSCAKESLTVLSLHRNLFSGSLPDFTMFSRLSKLSLHSNRLNGSLPSSLRNSSSLTIFDVRNNLLTGPVPDLSALRYLKVLQLQNNRLYSSVHPGLGQLSKLKHLDISSNLLTGDIGLSHLRNLSSLRYFDISFNSLTLNVDSSWVPPFRLDTIGLASCGLGSRFPEWLRTQTNYSRLDMSNSGISDIIPSWFWGLSSGATLISLSHNRLHGTLPSGSSFKFHMNPAIDLSFNLLEGTIPSFFENVSYLNFSRNSFSGPVTFLCSETYRLGIDLSHNNLSGKLPDCFPEWTMELLDLSYNSFSGQLPSSLGNLLLKSLHLTNNKFSGSLPLSLCNLTSLLYLDLGDNIFSGEIPRCLGIMVQNLIVLSVRNNFISGSIPPQFCHPSLQILDLSMNIISGVIPQCLCNLQAMTLKKSLPVVMEVASGTFSTIGRPYKDYIGLVLKGLMYSFSNNLELVKSLDLSGNNLHGQIPDQISCLTGLVSLNFSGNILNGSITSKIGSLKALQSLDLSNNRLSGEIPSTISDLNFLEVMSLANNKFSGRIPTGTQIQGFSASAFSGNPGLCGEPLPNKCPGDVDGDGKAAGVKEDDQNSNDKNGIFDLGMYISIALGFITGFWGICGALVLKRSWRYAYFRFWTHAYDKLYVLVTLKVVRRQRQFLA